MSIDVLETQPPLSEEDAKQFSPLALAFLGDSVYEVMVREALLRQANRPTRSLHALAVAHVRAGYQAEAANRIMELLSEDEADILRRGRNASGISVPKSATPAVYRMATGFECLFGYLYLCGKTLRLQELFQIVWEEHLTEE
ncbi:MAG: ribonuclease III [Oscillospiraceae bacterium]|nr:ribonuclease III [Oscillospiraceae bacterium]